MVKKIDSEYLRSFVFGCQDALVSTTGVVVGVNAAVSDKRFVLLTAIITIMVEALSMSAGQYLSEKTIHDMPNNHHKDNLFLGGFIMFVAYILGGLIPVLPVLFFSGPIVSLLSVLGSFFGLFVLGYMKAKLFFGNPLRSSFEMLIIGGLAVLMGLWVGRYLKY
jgi:VIT1/CCC1 family predicted Fe2+/Mn2+ transporter